MSELEQVVEEVLLEDRASQLAYAQAQHLFNLAVSVMERPWAFHEMDYDMRMFALLKLKGRLEDIVHYPAPPHRGGWVF